jgi:hypothetical protein
VSPPFVRQTTLRVQKGSTRAFGALALVTCLIGCQGLSGPRAPASGDAGAADASGAALPAVAAAPPAVLAPGEEIDLFDGSSLGSWKPEDTGKEAAVEVADGAIQLGWGDPGTAIDWTGTEIPESYELSLEVMRIEGSGSGYWFLTFPIDADRTCTLTLANDLGWLCGESGPAGAGALTRSFGLDGEGWHPVRVRVVRGRVEAFLGDEDLVVEPTAASPVELSDRPSPPSLEISTWSMTAAVRDIHLKRLPDR